MLKNKGITLIALVVTIVVLLILAGVSITVVFGDHGIIEQAQRAADETNKAVLDEEDDIKNLGNIVNPKPPENISKNDSYVGYYVKIGEEYGIIYADLAVGTEGEKQWGSGNNGKYTIPKEENPETLKDYYIVEESHEEEGFETKPVLAVVNPNDVSKNKRFYVMALKDVSGGYHCWYDAAYDSKISDYNKITSENFGTGYTNTETMLQKWGEYGEKDDGFYPDIWGVEEVKEKFAQGWFVPSMTEWISFAGELGIDRNNYDDKGLKSYYWSSSLYNAICAWYAHFGDGYMYNWYLNCRNLNYGFYVRLGTTY